MKHVFLVHSHITWIVAQLIINFKKINQNKIIVFKDRQFEIGQIKFNHLKYENKIGPESLFKISHSRFNELIEKNNSIINDDYILYIPTSWAIDTVALIASGYCRGFYYFEEGLSCYMESNFKQSHYGLIKNIYYKIRFKKIYNDFLLRYTAYNVNASKYRGVFGLHEESFKFCNNREILPFILNKINIESNDIFDVIIVFDGLSVFNIIQSDELLNILKNQIIPFVKEKGYRRIAYKMHPEHYNDYKGQTERENIIKIFNVELTKAVMLGSDTSLEIYLYNNNETDVITYVSSMTLYAHLFGANVFTVHDRVKAITNNNVLPDFLLNQIHHI